MFAVWFNLDWPVRGTTASVCGVWGATGTRKLKVIEHVQTKHSSLQGQPNKNEVVFVVGSGSQSKYVFTIFLWISMECYISIFFFFINIDFLRIFVKLMDF